MPEKDQQSIESEPVSYGTAYSKEDVTDTSGTLGSSSDQFEEDENPERGNWTGKLDFILSCIGFAVGLGNVWRFPYLCYRNGGGAFLIPYVIMLALAGLPLFFMELAFGQYASLGPLTIWKISPIFKGLGYAMVIISGLVCIYYNVIIAYVLFYLFASFTSELPWSNCAKLASGNWSTVNCTDTGKYNESTASLPLCNATAGIIGNCIRPKTPSEEYWQQRVLQLSPGIDHPGTVRWELALCLLLAWIIVFFCLIKGVKSSGKVVYFTATFPYVVLVILLVRGATLPGSLDGIKFYITPKWHLLGTAKVWGDAAVQIFYSLGPAWGGLITMASYNKFRNNCYRDAIIVAITNCGTSVFAGFVIFSVVGFMASKTGQPVDQVVASGPGLAFVAYPEGLARMPGAPFWSICFFFMLLTLGLDSQFVMLETVTSSFIDEFPDLLRPVKMWFTLGLCVIMYLLGLPCITNGGMYIFQLIDWYAGGISLMIVGLFECICICWIYGIRRFSDDIYAMIGLRPNYYWLVCWMAVTPAVILGIIIFSSVNYTPVKYNDYVYPPWAEAMGWMMSICSIIMLPIGAIVQLFRYNRWYQTSSFWELLRITSIPTEDWGPASLRNQKNPTTTDITKQTDMGNSTQSISSKASTMYESHM